MKIFERPLLVALCIGVILIAIVVVTPLSFDDFVLRTMAMYYYRFGRLPYLGSWDHNFPGILIFHYLAIVLFGERDISERFLDVLVQLGFSVLLYGFLRTWMRGRIAAFGVVLYLTYYVSGGPAVYSQRDVYAAMALIGSLYLLVQTSAADGAESRGTHGGFRPGTFRIGLSGFIAGFSVLIRPTFVLPVLLIAVYILRLPYRGTARRWKMAISFLTIGAIPCFAVILFYATIPGGLMELYRSTVLFNLDVYTKLHGDPSWICLNLVWKGLLLPFAVGGMIWARQGKLSFLLHRSLRREDQWLYGGLLATLLFSALVMQKYFPYHFAPFYIFLCPFSALGIEWVCSRIHNRIFRYSALVAFVFLSTFFLTSRLKAPFVFVRAWLHGDDAASQTYSAMYSNPDFGAIPEREVIHYVSLPGNSSGAVEVCSFEPSLRAHLDRRPSGPYNVPTAIALTSDSQAIANPTYTDYQRAWRTVYFDSLCSVKPSFIIFARNTGILSWRDPYRCYLQNLPGFDSLLQTSYRYDTEFGCYQIFRRRPVAAAPDYTP